jgi:Mg-chelatase subunit ChlD
VLSDGREAVLAAAQTWAAKNTAAGQAVALVTSEDVELGVWEKDTASFRVIPENSTETPSAVRVTCRRTSARGNSLKLFFAPLLGVDEADLTVSAIASAKSRDYMVVIDCSGSMTKQTDEDEVAADLLALGLLVEGDDGDGKKKKNSASKIALSLTYDGSFYEFADVYEIGEKWLHPDIRIQPLAATKVAAALSVATIDELGYDDLVGAVAFSSQVDWVEPLTTDYTRVQAKLRGATKYGGTKLHDGIRAAREELLSERARLGAQGVIVLMTDGKSSNEDALAEAQLAVDAGMIVHVVGLGTNIDYDLLNTIAALGGGVAIYVDNTTDPEVYGPELEAAFSKIAQEEVGFSIIQ